MSIIRVGGQRTEFLAITVRDRPGAGNTLAVRLVLDQTDLSPMAAQLGRVASEFPVIGRPDA